MRSRRSDNRQLPIWSGHFGLQTIYELFGIEAEIGCIAAYETDRVDAAWQGFEAAVLNSNQMVRRNFDLKRDIQQRSAIALTLLAQLLSDTFQRNIVISR